MKAAFKNSSIVVQFLMIVVVVFYCLLISSILTGVLCAVKLGISPEAIKAFLQNMMEYPDLMRGMQFLQSLGLFLFPAVVCAWLFSEDYKEYLGIDQPVYSTITFWAVVSMVVALPFLNWTYHLNKQMAFPEALRDVEIWMKESEAMAEKVMELLLETNHLPTILFNFLIICVIAAVGEEFMFRGLLQKFFGRMIRSPHVLIWIIAILFSIIHFQFYGFVTRMLLGAWLGYLMYYTKTIWIPVLAHFTNNFIAVSLYYVYKDAPDEMKKIDALGTGSTWWLAIASLALFVFCFHRIKKTVQQ